MKLISSSAKIRDSMGGQVSRPDAQLSEIAAGSLNEPVIINALRAAIAGIAAEINNPSMLPTGNPGDVGASSIDHQTDISSIRESITKIEAGVANQSAIINDKLGEIIIGSVNEQAIINNLGAHLGRIAAGLNNQSNLLNNKLGEIIASLVNQQRILNEKLSKIIEAGHSHHQWQAVQERLATLSERLELLEGHDGRDRIASRSEDAKAQRTGHAGHGTSALRSSARSVGAARRRPTAAARNTPGTLLNAGQPSGNPALRAVRQLLYASELNKRAWPEQLEMALAELQEIPGANDLIEKAAADRRFSDVGGRRQLYCRRESLNLDGALFLYWLLRRLRPRTVVESGTANGFYTGVMLLALAKNDNNGKLHAINRLKTIAAGAPRWPSNGQVVAEAALDPEYLGRMVPENMRENLEIHFSERGKSLSRMFDNLEPIDLFFHRPHGYAEGIFTLRKVQRKLSANGVIVAKDIARNPALWDFAERYGVPAYNFCGLVGAAFFG